MRAAECDHPVEILAHRWDQPLNHLIVRLQAEYNRCELWAVPKHLLRFFSRNMLEGAKTNTTGSVEATLRMYLCTVLGGRGRMSKFGKLKFLWRITARS